MVPDGVVFNNPATIMCIALDPANNVKSGKAVPGVGEGAAGAVVRVVRVGGVIKIGEGVTS